MDNNASPNQENDREPEQTTTFPNSDNVPTQDFSQSETTTQVPQNYQPTDTQTSAVSSVIPLATNERVTQLRSIFLKALLGCLIASALVAVIAILVGSMGETAWRAIGTVFSAMVHIGILFTIISMTANGNDKMIQTTNFVINSTMLIAIVSFFTSVFGIWNVIDGEISAKLYLTYAVVMFVILHTKTLMDVDAVYAKVRPYMMANFVFIGIVALLILGAVYVPDGLDLLSGFYGRLLAASAIIDVTLSILIAVMHRLYLQKHPELQSNAVAKSGGSAGRIIGGIVLFVVVIWPLFGLLGYFL